MIFRVGGEILAQVEEGNSLAVSLVAGAAVVGFVVECGRRAYKNWREDRELRATINHPHEIALQRWIDGQNAVRDVEQRAALDALITNAYARRQAEQN